jgi:hypothetical protein
MKLHHFVSGSAVILAGWLALTFVYDMPSQRYPRMEKHPKVSEIEQMRETAAIPATAPAEEESRTVQLSASP